MALATAAPNGWLRLWSSQRDNLRRQRQIAHILGDLLTFREPPEHRASHGVTHLRVLVATAEQQPSAGADEVGARPYRFGYGVIDKNLNGARDQDERKVYFEISDYSTNYIFYGDPGS